MKLHCIRFVLIIATQLHGSTTPSRDNFTTPPSRERTLPHNFHQPQAAQSGLYRRTSPSSYPMPSGMSTDNVLIARRQNNQSSNIHFAGFEQRRGPQIYESTSSNSCNSRLFLLENSRIW